jgi:ankyrin repeat protein
MPLWDFALFENGQARSMSEMAIFRQSPSRWCFNHPLTLAGGGIKSLGMASKSADRSSHRNTDKAGRSELHYAVVDRNVEQVKELIRQGMSVNLVDRDGWTPLHFAAQNYDEGIARLLLDSGASVDPRDANGNTPLSTAVFNSRGRGELIRLLRERGADATSTNKFEVSPVSLARTIANYDVARFFNDLNKK